ncbi:MAG: type II secretion system ATPase GspE [Chromatiales bacterium]|nr:type II secretion system ATPase GspE [Chromatiales bacterium]
MQNDTEISTAPASAPLKLGERLVQAGKLQPVDLDRALRTQQETEGLLGFLLVRLGMISERDLGPILAEHLGVRLVTKTGFPEFVVMEDAIPVPFLKHSKILPLEETDDTLTVAMACPQDEFSRNALALATGRKIDVVLAMPSEIEAALERLYGGKRDELIEDLGGAAGSEADDLQRLKDMASEAPVIRLVNLIITRAVDSRVSDIHIEPFMNSLKVRYRIDGVLHEVESPPAKLTAAVISRVKIMSKLNIAERRLPQDGRIQLRVQGKEIDLRVSTVPTLHGESVVMRILDKGSVEMSLDALDFAPDTLAGMKELLDKPNGILLVTGPTGSGKTTTLYAGLTGLNRPENKILTVEDPVEYQLEGINQIHVKAEIGLTFANALRAIVRQDPDIIMIGEMRDLETAQIAIQSALTGHLVLSTLHTNDAPSGVTRLLDMGVEDYLITSTVNGILAQRLVRRLCGHCKQPYQALPESLREMGIDHLLTGTDHTLWHSTGCDECGHTGFRGRVGIHELLTLTDPLRRLVLDRADAGVLQAKARELGMRTMYEDGILKAALGLTTVEEVLRVTREE